MYYSISGILENLFLRDKAIIENNTCILTIRNDYKMEESIRRMNNHFSTRLVECCSKMYLVI